jgi:hypothetical protein
MNESTSNGGAGIAHPSRASNKKNDREKSESGRQQRLTVLSLQMDSQPHMV